MRVPRGGESGEEEDDARVRRPAADGGWRSRTPATAEGGPSRGASRLLRTGHVVSITRSRAASSPGRVGAALALSPGAALVFPSLRERRVPLFFSDRLSPRSLTPPSSLSSGLRP